VLNRLKRQNDVAYIPRLPILNQLDLAFVLKQQKPILLRQRLIRFQIPKYFLLFLISQSTMLSLHPKPSHHHVSK